MEVGGFTPDKNTLQGKYIGSDVKGFTTDRNTLQEKYVKADEANSSEVEGFTPEQLALLGKFVKEKTGQTNSSDEIKNDVTLSNKPEQEETVFIKPENYSDDTKKALEAMGVKVEGLDSLGGYSAKLNAETKAILIEKGYQVYSNPNVTLIQEANLGEIVQPGQLLESDSEQKKETVKKNNPENVKVINETNLEEITGQPVQLLESENKQKKETVKKSNLEEISHFAMGKNNLPGLKNYF